MGPVQDPAGEQPVTYSWPEQLPSDVAAIDRSAPVENLEDALQRAYWFNPELLAARATKRAFDYRLPQAKARFGPSVSYEIDYGFRRDRVELPTGDVSVSSGWAGTVSLIASQPVWGAGRLAANERQAVAQIAFQRSTLRFAEQQLIFDVMFAYVGVIRDRNSVAIARDNLELLELELRETQARRKVRESTVTDVDQVRTRAEVAAAELALAEAALEASEALFLSVVGSSAGELAPPNPIILPVSSRVDAVSYALERNPLIEAARAREQSSRSAARAALAERLPELNFRGRLDLAPASPYDNRRRQRGVVAELVLSGPLFDSGLLAARHNEAKMLNDADWRLIDQALRELRAETTSAWASWRGNSAARERFAEASEAAQAAYDGASIQQKAGFRTTLDILILARDLLTVRNRLNVSSADTYLAKARLLLALGELEVEYLQPAATAYDPEAHLESVARDGSTIIITPLMRSVLGLAAPLPASRESRD